MATHQTGEREYPVESIPERRTRKLGDQAQAEFARQAKDKAAKLEETILAIRNDIWRDVCLLSPHADIEKIEDILRRYLK